MSKTGYYGDFGSFAEEQIAYQQHIEQQEQEPEVVPCPKCNGMMYETEDFCGGCRTLETSNKRP